MEDRKLNEKESLELITQMIRNTRRNLDAGSGNMFLLWGYVCVLLTLVVGLLGNSRCGLPAELYFCAEKGQAGELVYR